MHYLFFHYSSHGQRLSKIDFKNMRRVPRSSRTGLDFTPPDRKKESALHQGLSHSGRILDDLTYQRHKTALSQEYDRKMKITESTLMLMQETAANRRKWIQEERPSVTIVIKEFPCLKEYLAVSVSFTVEIRASIQ